MRVGVVLYDRTRRHMYTSAALLTSARGSTAVVGESGNCFIRPYAATHVYIGGAAHISQRKYHLRGVVEVVEADVAAVAVMLQVQVEAEVRARRGQRREHRLGR